MSATAPALLKIFGRLRRVDVLRTRALGSDHSRAAIPCRRLPQMVCEATSRPLWNSTDGHRRLYEQEAPGRPQSRHTTQRDELLESLLSPRREPRLVPGGDCERHSITALAA